MNFFSSFIAWPRVHVKKDVREKQHRMSRLKNIPRNSTKDELPVVENEHVIALSLYFIQLITWLSIKIVKRERVKSISRKEKNSSSIFLKVNHV